jgi:hypothetical protein
VRKISCTSGNESIIQILRSDDYEVKFPIYATMIHSNFRKGEKRKELLEQGYKIFHSLSLTTSLGYHMTVLKKYLVT